MYWAPLGPSVVAAGSGGGDAGDRRRASRRWRRRGPEARVVQLVRHGCGWAGPDDPRVLEACLLEDINRVSCLFNRS